MPLFCKTCNNLLVPESTADKFYFKCHQCSNVYEPTDEDTLQYENISGTNFGIYNIILKNAGKDPLNPKINKKCPTCNYHMARQVRLGVDMRLINVCMKCDYYWFDVLEEKKE